MVLALYGSGTTLYGSGTTDKNVREIL